ncbi:MAG: hypothetical protein QXT72_04020 [Candidatus Micrarchaeia archaeon]
MHNPGLLKPKNEIRLLAEAYRKEKYIDKFLEFACFIVDFFKRQIISEFHENRPEKFIEKTLMWYETDYFWV